MGNKVYFIGLKCSVAELAEKVGLIMNIESDEKEIAYMGFWNNVCIIEYDGNTDFYTVKENIFGNCVYHICYGGATLINYCNDNNIQFPIESPIGQFFASYSMTHLALVRWAADVAFTRDFYNSLLEE